MSSRLTETELVWKGRELVGEYLGETRSRAEILRDLAKVLVELRSRFTTKDGATDWAGRSFDYRNTVNFVYAVPGVDGDDGDALRSAVRYHVGNIVRVVAPPDELRALGLIEHSPAERVRTRRAEIASLVQSLLLREGELSPTAVLESASRILSLIDDEAIKTTKAEDREEVDVLLISIRQRVEMLRSLERRDAPDE